MTIGDHLLNKTATVTRPAHAHDGQGGDTETHAAHPTSPTLALRYYAASLAEQVIGGREDERISHIGYCKPDAGIARDDRITVDGITFDVRAVGPPSVAHHLKLRLKELHPDA